MRQPLSAHSQAYVDDNGIVCTESRPATALAHFPDHGLNVIVLTNATQPPFTIRELAGEIAGFFLDR